MTESWPPTYETAVFGMGCFWGVERIFWRLPGVYATAVGYAGGAVVDPTYWQVCQGTTGHAEVVQVLFDPTRIEYEQLLQAFWENHDPTQGARQGNDVGTEYRSVIYTTSAEQLKLAERSKSVFQPVVTAAGLGMITTHIGPLPNFYLAEEYHQQYLAKNPGGYCNHGPNGLRYPLTATKG